MGGGSSRVFFRCCLLVLGRELTSHPWDDCLQTVTYYSTVLPLPRCWEVDNRSATSEQKEIESERERPQGERARGLIHSLAPSADDAPQWRQVERFISWQWLNVPPARPAGTDQFSLCPPLYSPALIVLASVLFFCPAASIFPRSLSFLINLAWQPQYWVRRKLLPWMFFFFPWGGKASKYKLALI